MKMPSYELVSVLSVRGFRRQLVLQGRKSPRLDGYSHLRLSVVDPADGTRKAFNGELFECEATELLKTLQLLQSAGLIAGARPAWDTEDPIVLHAAAILQYLFREKETDAEKGAEPNASGSADAATDKE